jgi:predicted amidohydrolase
MKSQTLKIAISQFPVSEDIETNKKYIKKHILKASSINADIIHFPEMALPGYNADLEKLNWDILSKSFEEIKDLAKENNLYVVLGSLHINKTGMKPFNCTCLISNNGQLIGEYYKQKLYGSENDRFSTKKNFLIKEINDVKCGFLICYDSCFPELFQHYRENGVKLIFLSYYNAKSTKSKNSMDKLMQAQFITRSTDNIIYISGSNSSARYSRMPSSFVRPDGKLFTMKRHKTGILLCEYPGEKLGWVYDNTSSSIGNL